MKSSLLIVVVLETFTFSIIVKIDYILNNTLYLKIVLFDTVFTFYQLPLSVYQQYFTF